MRSETTVNRGASLLVLLAWVAGGAGCGSFVESDDKTVRATIGATGGALHLDGLSVVVPVHALVHTVTLSLSHPTFESPNGHAYVLDPPDTVFDVAAPAMVTIAYDAATYQHPSEVFVATYMGGTWHSLPAAGTPEGGAAHATTTHAGTFGLINCPGGVCPITNADAGAEH